MQSLSITNGKQNVKQQALAAVQEGSLASRMPDWLGATASIGCAIHCAAMPFVITLLPVLGLGFLADGAFHRVMVGVCALLALFAFVPGWRIHRKWLPAGVAAAGLTMIALAAFGMEESCACCALPPNSEVDRTAQRSLAAVCNHEDCAQCSTMEVEEESAQVSKIPTFAGITPWITPFGGILLVSAHLVNRRFSCQCSRCSPETTDVS